MIRAGRDEAARDVQRRPPGPGRRAAVELRGEREFVRVASACVEGSADLVPLLGEVGDVALAIPGIDQPSA